MRYALIATNKDGARINIFTDCRTFASIHAARRSMQYCNSQDIDIEEVVEPITDTQRLDWVLKTYDTTRDLIDSKLKQGEKHE